MGGRLVALVLGFELGGEFELGLGFVIAVDGAEGGAKEEVGFGVRGHGLDISAEGINGLGLVVGGDQRETEIFLDVGHLFVQFGRFPEHGDGFCILPAGGKSDAEKHDRSLMRGEEPQSLSRFGDGFLGTALAIEDVSKQSVGVGIRGPQADGFANLLFDAGPIVDKHAARGGGEVQTRGIRSEPESFLKIRIGHGALLVTDGVGNLGEMFEGLGALRGERPGFRRSDVGEGFANLVEGIRKQEGIVGSKIEAASANELGGVRRIRAGGEVGEKFELIEGREFRGSNWRGGLRRV